MKIISLENIKIRVEINDGDPEKFESFLLERNVYYQGEQPPLNGQYGKYHFDEVDMKI